MNARRRTRWLLGICAVLLTSCTPVRRSVTNPGEVPADQALLVGRAELNPPLSPSEQDIQHHSPFYEHENAVNVILQEQPTPLTNDHNANLTGSIEQRFGESFRVPVERRTWFVSGIAVFLRVGMANDVAYLVRPLRVDLMPGDEAAYIGTLRYTRNEFFDLVNLEVIDDYERENAAFVNEFGAGRTLQKRLAQFAAPP